MGNDDGITWSFDHFLNFLNLLFLLLLWSWRRNAQNVLKQFSQSWKGKVVNVLLQQSNVSVMTTSDQISQVINPQISLCAKFNVNKVDIMW